mgnify:CR=1 FL=1
MAAAKVKVEVVTSFIDKHSGDVHKVGEVMSVTRKRLDEIASVDPNLVREYVEPEQTDDAQPQDEVAEQKQE